MLIKTLICTVCLVSLSFANIATAKISAESNFRTSAVTGSQKENMVIPHIVEDNYIYKRVLINGVWWIYVYTADGSFVDVYPDEDL